MAGGSVRFIQSSDLQLHKPVIAGAQCAARAADVMSAAPRDAAQNVFDAAIHHRVDFLLLAGNVGDPRRIGAVGFEFLAEQFARLEAEGILVYWSLGDSDRARRWPTAIQWPANVHQFANPAPTVTTYQRAGEPLVDIIGASWTANRNVAIDQFEMDASCNRAIVLGGNIRDGHETLQNVQHWALGGRDDLATLELANGLVHFSGSPQSRGPQHSGPHGCTLVEIPRHGKSYLEPLECDSVRFVEEGVDCEGSDTASIAEALKGRAAQLARLDMNIDVIVKWTCRSAESNASAHVLRDESRRWLEKLSRLLEKENPRLLGQSFQFDFPSQCKPVQEESLRASYLDTLATMAEQDQVLSVLSDAAAGLLPPELGALLSRNESGPDSELVRQAAELGDELLGTSDHSAWPSSDTEAA